MKNFVHAISLRKIFNGYQFQTRNLNYCDRLSAAYDKSKCGRCNRTFRRAAGLFEHLRICNDIAEESLIDFEDSKRPFDLEKTSLKGFLAVYAHTISEPSVESVFINYRTSLRRLFEKIPQKLLMAKILIVLKIKFLNPLETRLRLKLLLLHR